METSLGYISFALKDNQLWYFYIPKLTDPDGINTRFVEVNDEMIFIDIGVGYTHTRNFIYNTIWSGLVFSIIHSVEINPPCESTIFSGY